jgi:hypothetical protein
MYLMRIGIEGTGSHGWITGRNEGKSTSKRVSVKLCGTSRTTEDWAL